MVKLNIENKFLRKIFAYGNKSEEVEHKNEELEQTTQAEISESYVQLILLVDAFLDRGHYYDFEVDGHISYETVHFWYKHALELKATPERNEIYSMSHARLKFYAMIQELNHHGSVGFSDILDRFTFDAYEYARKWAIGVSSDIYSEMVALYLPQIERVLEFDNDTQIDGLKAIYYTMKSTHLDMMYSLHTLALEQRNMEIHEQARLKSTQDKNELECLRASLRAIEQSM